MSSVANSSLLPRLSQSAPGQDPRERPAISRARVDIRLRVDAVAISSAALLNRSGCRFFADENFFDSALTPRFVADAGQRNSRVGNLIFRER